MASIAEHSERLERLFLTKEVSKEGIYAVAICLDGIWQEVIIDDWIPCDGKLPIFNKSFTNELWVILIEKAWAKCFGAYMNIDSGLTREALRNLTGASCKTFMMLDSQYTDEFMWKSLREAD